MVCKAVVTAKGKTTQAVVTAWILESLDALRQQSGRHRKAVVTAWIFKIKNPLYSSLLTSSCNTNASHFGTTMPRNARNRNRTQTRDEKETALESLLGRARSF